MANVSGAVAPQSKAGSVKEVTTASFRADVLTASTRQPVLVDFWAPWCGPCKQLAPALEKAVADSGGKVTLVKMNIDEHPQIAGQLGIQSIPAVIAFDKGQPVDGFVGALPESQIRGFIERLVGPLQNESAALLVEAEETAAKGDATGAAAIYAEILAEDPGEAKAIGGLAKRWLVPGWRVGWVVLHERGGVFKEVRRGLGNLSQVQLHPNTVFQAALPTILDTPQEFFDNVVEELKGNAKLIVDELAKAPGLHVIEPQGALYAMVSPRNVERVLTLGGVEVREVERYQGYLCIRTKVNG